MNTESDSFYISILNIICIGVHHTVLQMLYNLMMARLNPKTYSPFVSITNVRFVRMILTGFYYYYWVLELSKLRFEVISNGIQSVHSFCEIGQINQKFLNEGS
jgi:hypothetical protein